MFHGLIGSSGADRGGLAAASLWTTVRVTACAACLVTFGNNFAVAVELTPGEQTRLSAGEAVVRVNEAPRPADGAIFGAIDIPASPSQVWSVLYDCATAASFMPSLKSCTVLKSSPDQSWDVREHRVEWTSFLPEVRSVFRSEYRRDASIRFARVEGDLTHLDGEWRLEPLAGGRGTRLVYDTRVGFHALVPSFMVRGALTEDIPVFLATIRTEVLRRSLAVR
ncbi:MAG: SRPBCC family protein [Hyphomicrobium sp.]